MKRAAVALIDESRCIGCTLCIDACPVDAIVGARAAHAYRGRALVHRLRALRAALPGRLHRHGAGTRRVERAAEARRGRARAPAQVAARSGSRSRPAARTGKAILAAVLKEAHEPAEAPGDLARLQKANPDPTTELEYRTPYELLVAVVLSAQATDKSVNLATAKLFPVANTPEKMVAAGRRGARGVHQDASACTAPRRRTSSRCRSCCSTSTAARYRRTARRSSGLPGRRPQDRERGAQHRLRPADHGGRHAHLPRREPHRDRAGKGSVLKWKRSCSSSRRPST